MPPTNLERNLYFSVQLLEMGVPLVVAMNMMDVARKRGIRLDEQRLAAELGCPVVPVVAISREGLTELQARILAAADGRQQAGFALAHEECVEQAITALAPRFAAHQDRANTRWLALKLLEDDPVAVALADEPTCGEAADWRQIIDDRSCTEADLHIADTRYGHAHTLAQRVIRERGGRARPCRTISIGWC